MTRDCRSVGRTVQERAEAYFIGKDPLDIELHNAQFLKLSGENFSVGWGRAVVNRPKRAPDARS
jgi:hypothetical protein